MSEHHYGIGMGQIFTVFFVMLGPEKLLSPYYQMTASLTQVERRKLGLRAGLTAFLILVLGGFIGAKLLTQWSIEPAVLVLGAGILFFLVALNPLLRHESPVVYSQSASAQDIAFNHIVSPYGLAAVIVLFSTSQDLNRFLVIIGCLGLIMLINILFMTFGKEKEEKEKSMLLKTVTNVLKTLQLAHAIDIILLSLNGLGILNTKGPA